MIFLRFPQIFLFNFLRFITDLNPLVLFFLQILKKKQDFVLNSILLLPYLRPNIFNHSNQ